MVSSRQTNRLRLGFHLQEAKKNGITSTEIAEIITHIAFYAGWPKAWAAFPMSTFLLPTSLSNLVATTIGISIIHQRRWSNAYWCCRTRLVSGVGKACAGDSPGNCHPHPGRCEALAQSCRGYPIWREQAPRLINTFIESHNLKGKTVVRHFRRQYDIRQCSHVETQLSGVGMERGLFAQSY